MTIKHEHKVTIELIPPKEIYDAIKLIPTILQELQSQKQNINKKFKEMADKFEPLVAEVAENGNVIESAIAAFNGLAEQLQEAKDDPEQIQEIVTSLKSQKERLAAAIVQGTPADPSTGGGTTVPDPSTGEGTGSPSTGTGPGTEGTEGGEVVGSR